MADIGFRSAARPQLPNSHPFQPRTHRTKLFSAFLRLDGSWYIEPLAEGVIYVRYYLVAELDPSVPEVLRAWAVKRYLRDGTRGVVQALAHEAGWRP
jgi:hypothetical protein